MFNEWFAKDTNRKVKAALRAKFNVEECTFAYAPLGYIQHPEIRNMLMIDEETHWIIEKIFELAFNDADSGKITRILGNEKISTARWLYLSKIWDICLSLQRYTTEKAYV